MPERCLGRTLLILVLQLTEHGVTTSIGMDTEGMSCMGIAINRLRRVTESSVVQGSAS